MINLFENYTERERDLEYSLNYAGANHPTIVLNDDGFLPPHIVSPIGFFTQMDKNKKNFQTTPKFFNDLKLPSYWEIRADGNSAEIFEGYKKKGNIKYSNRPGDYRIIQAVEWLNESNRVRAVDLYNQNGNLLGKKTFSDGEHVLTSYFDAKGREVILFNHILQTIQLQYNNKHYIFSDYVSFILFYLEQAQLPIQRILYNSLGYPYFVTQALQERYPEQTFSHLLFWQETSEKMPGNMQALLHKKPLSTRQIVVQDQGEYERLLLQWDTLSEVRLTYLGYLFNFKREAMVSPTILIHTNSDQIEAIQELIQVLPEFKFNISARTEMSAKLMQLEDFSNVALYPNISTEELSEVIKESSFYLDINQGGELDNIVRQSFEHNLLLFAFSQTLHNARMVSPSHIYNQKEYVHLANELQSLVNVSSRYVEAIKVQWHDAGQVTVKEYKEILE